MKGKRIGVEIMTHAYIAVLIAATIYTVMRWT
jgi:hypothetical protein